jgi:hypothetical protein
MGDLAATEWGQQAIDAIWNVNEDARIEFDPDSLSVVDENGETLIDCFSGVANLDSLAESTGISSDILESILSPLGFNVD